MTNSHIYDKASTYQIRIQGALDQSWSDWFDGFTISQQNGETILIGKVLDQAALHSILSKINDLGLAIMSVERVEPASKNKHPKGDSL
jgi:hypothetical protein